VEAVVSRRRDRAWETFLSEHTVGGGEYVDTDWESAARALGVPVEDFMRYPHGPDDEGSFDDEGLRDAVRGAFYNPDGDEPPPLVMVTLKCQRCDRRLDTLRVRSKRWIAPQRGSGDDGWKLENPTVTSEAWSRDIGDSIGEFFRKFEGRSVRFTCACGAKDIQFSIRRIRETLERLTPDNPRWSPGDPDDAWILLPETRHATIRG
jgi:hypothetical protein